MLSMSVISHVNVVSCEELYPAAEALCREIPLLTSSQISGLKNIARSAPSTREILDYINHQKEKTKNTVQEKEYWAGISKELRSIVKRSKDLGEEIDLEKKDKPELELVLCREFIYHLAAEQRFRLQR